MADTLQQFAGKMDKLGARQASVAKDGAKAAAKIVESTVLPLLAEASGGDLVLNRVNDGKGAKIGVVQKTVDNGVLVKAVGPVQLIENRLHEHVIGPRGVNVPKGTRRSRAGRQKAVDRGTAIYGQHDVLHFGDVFARWVLNPGVAVNKHPWARGVEAATPLVPAVFDKVEKAVLLEVFK